MSNIISCEPNQENCPYLEKSAEIAVKRVFAILGVNIDVPKDVEEFRENLRFGATLRRAADRGLFAFITVLVGAIAVALWAGIVSKITGHS